MALPHWSCSVPAVSGLLTVHTIWIPSSISSPGLFVTPVNTHAKPLPPIRLGKHWSLWFLSGLIDLPGWTLKLYMLASILGDLSEFSTKVSGTHPLSSLHNTLEGFALLHKTQAPIAIFKC